MHKPVFLAAAGGIAAAGALMIATALPAGAATAGLADTPPITCVGPVGGGTTPCTPPANTPVTFSVASTGTLNITVPEGDPAIPLGTAIASAGGSTLGSGGDFGHVTVTDNRSVNPSPWVATVSCTNFLNTTTGKTTDTIPVAAATYTTGTVGPDITANGGVGSNLPFDAALATAGQTVTLSGVAQAILTETGYDGVNAATWIPTITVAIPPNAVVGIYNAVVTHSVS